MFARKWHCFSDDYEAEVAHPITIEIAHGHLAPGTMPATSAPEVVAVPVQCRSRLNFDVAIHSHLTREPKILFVTQAGEERQRVRHHRNFFKWALRCAVLQPLFHDHAATGTQAKTHAVDIIMRERVKLNSGLDGFPAKIGSGRNFDCLFLVHKCDGRHFNAIPETDVE